MNAAVVESFGKPPRYATFREPIAGEGEALVKSRVAAAAGLIVTGPVPRVLLLAAASVPLLIWALSPRFPLQGAHGEQEIIASAIFILASITDGLDGYLARRRGQITTLGMLLDPLADKLMVTTAFILLVAYNPRVMHPWIAVLVIGREFLVSGLRSIATSEGFTIGLTRMGKLPITDISQGNGPGQQVVGG